LPWAKSEMPGASDLVEVLTGFLQKTERLIHWVDFANHPENSDKWYQRPSTPPSELCTRAGSFKPPQQEGKVSRTGARCLFQVVVYCEKERVNGPVGCNLAAPT
jgi:hypothetical protein